MGKGDTNDQLCRATAPSLAGATCQRHGRLIDGEDLTFIPPPLAGNTVQLSESVVGGS